MAISKDIIWRDEKSVSYKYPNQNFDETFKIVYDSLTGYLRITYTLFCVLV